MIPDKTGRCERSDSEELRAAGEVAHVCQICFANDFRPFIFARPMTNNEGIT